jgi:pSer/pThr/pTyr-binding forkhead associated (FHA) protein
MSTPGHDPAGAPESPAGAPEWQLAVAVDPSLDVEPDPASPPPEGTAVVVFAVDRPEVLMGRRDEMHGIRPEIDLRDPAVSRRHAKFLRLADGGLAVLDLASANGTVVNGRESPAGERRVLGDGDQIVVGRWTRITVRRRS